MSEPAIATTIRQGAMFLTFNRQHARNAINRRLIDECHEAFDSARDAAITALVLRGSRDVFSTGADFAEIASGTAAPDGGDADRLYELWTRMTTESFVTIAHVQGSAIASGVGFVAASDIVVAEPTATFALSELLFGLFPACVLPFLARRIGLQKAQYLALTTRSISGETARDWGLADECASNADDFVGTLLVRLRRVSPSAIKRLKEYSSRMSGGIHEWQSAAVSANREMFAEPRTREALARYSRTGMFPWEPPHAAE